MHFNSAVNVVGIKKATKDKKVAIKCSYCEKQSNDSNDNQDEVFGISALLEVWNFILFVSVVIVLTLNLMLQFSDDPQMWICLQCGNVACGRGEKGHAIVHHKTPRSGEHCVVVDTHTWKLWCYKCDDAVNNQYVGYFDRNVKILRQTLNDLFF